MSRLKIFFLMCPAKVTPDGAFYKYKQTLKLNFITVIILSRAKFVRGTRRVWKYKIERNYYQQYVYTSAQNSYVFCICVKLPPEIIIS